MIAVAVIAAVLAFAFLFLGTAKTLSTPAMRERAAHVRSTPGFYRVVGVLEVAGATGVVGGIWVPWLGALAAGGLVLLMLGAVIAHGRVGDGVKALLPAVALGVLALVYLVLTFGRL